MIETSNISSVKRSKSYRTILSTAKGLMNKHGIRRITVDELCSEAELSKMTFYRNFENKNEVALRVMEEIFEQGMEAYRAIMKSDAPFPEKMRRVANMKRKGMHEMGEEYLKDVYQGEDETLREYIEMYSRQAASLYRIDLEKAQKAGWIRKDIKIELVIVMLNTLHEKMKAPAVTDLYDSMEDTMVALTDFLFHGIMAQPQNQ